MIRTKALSVLDLGCLRWNLRLGLLQMIILPGLSPWRGGLRVLLLYYISAEASRPTLSVFGLTRHRFLLPEQLGSYPEQDSVCLE